METLPATLHETLKVALDDYKKVLLDPNYNIKMSVWHEPDDGGKTCNVCLAGAVIAKTLKVSITDAVGTPDECWGDDIAKPLYALDKLAEFNILGAWEMMYGSLKNAPGSIFKLHKFYRPFPSRFQDPNDWFHNMHMMREDLKKEGI